MRDNGLAGEDYVAVAELNPQLADAALVLLRDAGVPAYAEPGRLAPDLAEGPSTASIDRVFVVRASAEAARALLAERLPRMRHERLDVAETRSTGDEPAGWVSQQPERADDAEARDPGEDPVDSPQDSPGPGVQFPDGVDDETWAGIVASFRAPSADVGGRVLPPSVEPAAGSDGPPAEGTRHLFADDGDLTDLEEDHFEPEAPPPLPRVSWSDGLAWAAVLLMPVLFLLALWLDIDVTGWLGLFGVAAFVGGFLVLVSRLGDGSDDGWDDGAVI